MKIKKKVTRNRLRIAGIGGGVIIVLLVLWSWRLFAEPGNYDPPRPIDSNEMSLYLTNQLGPQLHNKAQYREPFRLVVDEYGVGDIIAHGFSSQQFGEVAFQNICVAFEPAGIFLMGRCEYKGFEFVCTLVVKPKIDKNGDFSLRIKKVKAGKSRLPFASMIIRKKIAGKLEKAVSEKLFGNIAELLLKNGNVEPIMKVGGVRIRAERIETVKDKMIIHFVPAEAI